MAAVQRFEELVAWRKARDLSRAVYAATSNGTVTDDWDFCRQIRRAAVSAISNIAEGFERRTPAEFRRFLLVAKGSCGEVRSLLYVGLDVGHFDAQCWSRLSELSDEVARLLTALRNSIRASQRAPRNSVPGTRDAELRTRNSGLRTRHLELDG